MATRSATRRTASTKPAPEPEVVEDDEFEDAEDEELEDAPEDDDDLEELDEDEEPEEAPAPKAKKVAKAPAAPKAPAQPKIEFGSKELAAHVTETTGETYDARAVRMLLRKLAKDEKFQRVVGEDRSRYSFAGPNDPAVQMVIDMVKSGAAKELKQAGLQAVKDKAAAAKAAKAAAKAAEVEDAEEMEEVEEEAPKPRTRRVAAKSAAPAKATPAPRRKTAQAK
jgi:hypothetical protein